MYALSVSAEGDCYLRVPLDAGIEAAALGASDTTLTPLSTPVPVKLADPSGDPVLARSSNALPCPAVPSGSLSGLHLPSFSTNLVSASGSLATPCSCRLLTHQTLLRHHHLGHPSVPRLRGMHSRLLCAAPFSSSFPPTSAPLQTLHMDVWGPARVTGQGRKRYFVLVVDGDTRYTTVFPLHSKGEVPDVLIPWIRAVRLQLRKWFRQDLPVLRLHSDRGGEFSSDLREFCRGEGIPHSFTLPASAQKNGIAKRRIGLVMEVARTTMIHAAALHFLWPFAVRVPFWGSRAFVRDTSANKLSTRNILCVFLGFPPDAPGWQFYHPTSHRVFPSHDVTFDESVPFSISPPPPPLFLAPGPPTVDPLPPQGPAPSSVSQVDPLLGTVLAGVACNSGAAQGAASGGAGSRGAEPGGAEPGGAESEGAGSRGAEPGGAELGGAEFGGAVPGGAETAGVWLGVLSARVSAGAGGTRGAAAAGPKGARTRGTGAAASGGVGGAGAGDPTEPGASGAGVTGAGSTGAGGAGATGAGARGTGAGGAGAGGAGGAGAVDPGAGAGGAGGTGAGGTVRSRPYFIPLLQQVLSVPSSTSLTPHLLCPPLDRSQPPLKLASPLLAPSPYAEQTGGLTERREPASRLASPVHTGRRVPRPRPPPVPGTHAMALRPSSVSLHVPLPAPPESSLPAVPHLESDLARATNPTVSRLLATIVIDPSFESAGASSLVAELVDFAATCCLDYATALVAESESASPLSVGGECAHGTDVLEDRQEEFECLSSAVPRFASMLLAPEGDPDASDIPTPRSYAEAITVPPSPANIVDGMWIFRVKRPPGSPPAFKARYVARDFSQRQGGSLHEEIWLRRTPGFTGSFPAGTQWSLPRPVYGLRQAPPEWHDTVTTTLAAMGFTPSTADP
ncbi:unnamed protein product, partial [Closterium sp. NIES-53]